jgi:hypothetical protein
MEGDDDEAAMPRGGWSQVLWYGRVERRWRGWYVEGKEWGEDETTEEIGQRSYVMDEMGMGNDDLGSGVGRSKRDGRGWVERSMSGKEVEMGPFWLIHS